VNIRPIVAADLPALKAVIDATGLFSGEMLELMAAQHLEGVHPEIWLTAEAEAPVALAYAAPERMTEGCWNLLLIAVHPDRQGQGIGSRLTEAVEAELTAMKARVLLVETSSLPPFAPTRRFYQQRGYGEEARIRDFYQDREDKIVFRKALTPAP
jgi:ribosomal protein S18 acetylase RimI-like enzyme